MLITGPELIIEGLCLRRLYLHLNLHVLLTVDVWFLFFLIRRKGDPERAETFLQEALKSYVSEGWSLPVTHTRKQIAECQKLLGRTDEYP